MEPFQLDERIGKGGMGEVWRGYHSASGTPVAVKVIATGRTNEPRFRSSFRREVRAVAMLNHPGIVRIYDYGEHEPASSDDEDLTGLYFAMQLADGCLETGDVRSWASLRLMLRQVLDALAYAHARGLIHRDIKPANILRFDARDDGWRWALTDFGIAHHARSDVTRASRELSSASGTPLYMSPEQLRGQWRDFGPPTDLYAVGCMTWEVVSGRPPFTGRTLAELAAQHVSHSPPTLEPRFDVPTSFESWLRRLMAKDPRQRFQYAADAVCELDRLALRCEEDEPAAGPVTAPAAVETELGFEHTLPLLATTEITPPTLETTYQLPAGSMDSSPTRPHAERDSPARPPIPENWRASSATRPEPLAGTGLSLVGIRDVPLVGRDRERDLLWSSLQATGADGSPRIVVLRGPAGAGKSRIAGWFCRRAREVGAATVFESLRVDHHDPGDVLPDLVETAVRGWSLDRPDLRTRVHRMLSGEWGGGLVEAIVQLVRPATDDEQTQFEFVSRAHRARLAARALRRLADRTAIVRLEDVQWTPDGLDFLEWTSRQDTGRLMVVATVRDEDVDEDVSARLSALAETDAVEEVPLPPLSKSQVAELLTSVVVLDPTVVEAVTKAVDGNPLFGLQLLEHWSETGRLVPRDSGYSLDGSGAPADIHNVFERRIDHALGEFGDCRDDAARALELAAASGTSVDEASWRSAAHTAQIRVPRDFVEELVSRRLAVSRRRGWSFSHELVRRAAEAHARRAGRWEAHHLAWADTLQRLEDCEDARVARKLAHHYLAAKEEARALEPLLGSARASARSSRFNQALDDLEKYVRIVEAVDPEDADYRIARAAAFGAFWCYEIGDESEARNWAIRAAAYDDDDTLSFHARGVLIIGMCDADQLEYDAALGRYRQAREAARRAGDLEAEGLSHVGVALYHLEQRRFDDAIEEFVTATEFLRRLQSPRRLVFTLHQLARLHILRQSWKEASETIEQARTLAAEGGARAYLGGLVYLLANVRRHQQRYEEARVLAEHCLELNRDYDRSRDIDEGEAGLAQILLHLGRFEEARELLEPLRVAFEPPLIVGAEVLASLMCCAAARGDRSAWRRERDELEDWTSVWPPDEGFDDLADVLELAGDLAVDADWCEEAIDAWEFSKRQRQLLEHASSVERLDRKLSEVDSAGRRTEYDGK